MFYGKAPKDDGKYQWTNHVKDKMRFYRLSESLVKRVVRFPKRVEEGIAPNTIAVMQPRVAGGKTKEEIWVMYQELGRKSSSNHSVKSQDDHGASQLSTANLQPIKKRIITAWRYPGASPIGKPIPIPEDILRELS